MDPDVIVNKFGSGFYCHNTTWIRIRPKRYKSQYDYDINTQLYIWQMHFNFNSEYSDRIRSECPNMEPDPTNSHGSATLNFLYSCPAQFLYLSLSFLVWQQMKFLGAFSP